MLLALLYVVMAIQERRACWYAGAASATLYVWIFWEARLLMEAALQVFYIAMAMYGWWLWRTRADQAALTVQRWRWRQHLLALLVVALAATASGWLLDQHTDAALPYVDSMTTVAALVATWMVARKVLENWLYWIAIDALSIYVYLERQLDLTALLFAGYTLLAAAGYLQWRKHYINQNRQNSPTTSIGGHSGTYPSL